MARACLLRCLTFAFVAAAEANVVADLVQKEGDTHIHKATQQKLVSAEAQKPLSPTLKPESSKKFFSKDYPNDQAALRNGLHFKHPYPAVQDSNDFDKDFVKDQNTDNGEYFAQTNYDRIRAQIGKQIMKTEQALEKKKWAEKQLEKTLEDFKEDIAEVKDKETDSMDDLKEIDRQKEEAKLEQKEKKSPTPKSEPKEEKGCWWPWSMWCCGWWPWSCPTKPTAATPTDPMDKFRDAHEELASDVAGATRQVEQAVRDLEECQKELAEAQAELKRLVDELEKAKLKLAEAEEKVKQAQAQEDKAEEKVAVLKEKLAEEVAEYEAAQAAYLKEKQKVEKMAAELKVLAEKVEALRDAEDKNGGVYPVERSDPARRSSATRAQIVLPLLAVFAVMLK